MGIATQEVPTTIWRGYQHIHDSSLSRGRTAGMASLQLNPTARILEAVSQVPKLIVSVAQYPIQVHIDHVWNSGFTGSMSTFVHTCAGARAESCFGSRHAETVVARSFNCFFVGIYCISVRCFILNMPLPAGFFRLPAGSKYTRPGSWRDANF
jgi:hypothetical protein